jgi:hypothetical protein
MKSARELEQHPAPYGELLIDRLAVPVAATLEPASTDYNRWWVVRVAFALFEHAVVEAVSRPDTPVGREARMWVKGTGKFRLNGHAEERKRRWVFDFETTCFLLKMDPPATREGILAMPRGTFRNRGGRERRGRQTLIGR